MAEQLTIRKLIERLQSGDVRIPAFQRGYVWKPDQVAFLLDSLYKGYPIGTVFLWKTDVRLKNERNLGNFELPDPKKDYPVNYVLDGQQRITSLFSVFQTDLKPIGNLEWLDIYFDLDSDVDLQESNFLALSHNQVDSRRHFPMNTLFDSARYRKATETLKPDQIKTIDKLQEKFKEILIPVQEFETDDREKVAIVFERINRAGTELDTYQLMTAWSWSEEFDLIEQMNELSDGLEKFGYKTFGGYRDLQLKCFSGLLKGDARPKALFDMKGAEVRENFSRIQNGVEGAVDFLKKQLQVHSFEWLPYPAMMVSLVTFFATEKVNGLALSENQRKQLLRWFWMSNFSRRYSAGVGKTHEADLRELGKLKTTPDYKLPITCSEVGEDFFLDNIFNTNAINTKSFVLLLANLDPRSFLSGARVDLEAVLKTVNRNEFHHIHPKKHLQRLGVPESQINCLANFCFLSSGDNQRIKDKSPVEYKKLIPAPSVQEMMERAACSEDSLDLDFDTFRKKRAKILAEKANLFLKE